MRINSHHFPHETTWKVVTYMDARLEPYRTLVSFLGEALGPDYEVVLHDLTSEEGTIAAIVNNNISGRTEGAPLSNMALRFIHGKVYEKQPYVAGYQGASQAKGRLRSSTMFIKDGSELIGMLCINFDAAKYSRMAQELLSLCGAHQEPGPSVDDGREDPHRGRPAAGGHLLHERRGQRGGDTAGLLGGDHLPLSEQAERLIHTKTRGGPEAIPRFDILVIMRTGRSRGPSCRSSRALPSVRGAKRE